MLRLSRYNVVKELDGEVLVYYTLTSAFVKLAASLWKRFQNGDFQEECASDLYEKWYYN